MSSGMHTTPTLIVCYSRLQPCFLCQPPTTRYQPPSCKRSMVGSVGIREGDEDHGRTTALSVGGGVGSHRTVHESNSCFPRGVRHYCHWNAFSPPRPLSSSFPSTKVDRNDQLKNSPTVASPRRLGCTGKTEIGRPNSIAPSLFWSFFWRSRVREHSWYWTLFLVSGESGVRVDNGGRNSPRWSFGEWHMKDAWR